MCLVSIWIMIQNNHNTFAKICWNGNCRVQLSQCCNTPDAYHTTEYIVIQKYCCLNLLYTSLAFRSETNLMVLWVQRLTHLCVPLVLTQEYIYIFIYFSWVTLQLSPLAHVREKLYHINGAWLLDRGQGSGLEVVRKQQSTKETGSLLGSDWASWLLRRPSVWQEGRLQLWPGYSDINCEYLMQCGAGQLRI